MPAVSMQRALQACECCGNELVGCLNMPKVQVKPAVVSNLNSVKSCSDILRVVACEDKQQSQALCALQADLAEQWHHCSTG